MKSEAIDYAERALLGSLLMRPRELEFCGGLTAADFRDADRGKMFSAIVELGDLSDATLVALQLEGSGSPPPRGLPGWHTAVARMLDYDIVDIEAVPVYVQKIKEAAIERRITNRYTDGGGA